MPDIMGKGVDVSSGQGLPVNWTGLPAARDIQWAAVKFTELEANGNHYVNPDAKADWDWLWEHKKGRIAYLFAHPSRSVSDTLALFKSVSDRLGLEPGDGVCIDLEVTDGLSPAAVSSWARELASEMAKTFGRRPIIYTYEDFIHQGNCAGLGNCHLWIADQDVSHFSTLSAMQAAMGRPAFRQVEDVWVTAGMDGLVELSHLLKTEIAVIIELTLKASANGKFEASLADYLTTGNLSAKMPRGIHLRYLKMERV
jgi:GH25 family lysozyme M1 (1,4-beta-N-acetylmuramidase)